MTVEQIIKLCFNIAILVGIVIMIISLRKRFEKTKESSDLAKLRCKKDEINAIMNRLVSYANRTKEQIKLLWDNGIIDEELVQLRVTLAQYNEIKSTLTAEQLKHEREDYNKAVSNITKLFSSLKSEENKDGK